MNPYLITIDKIFKRYPDVVANNNVSFNIRKGKIHALLGENGAGKSTIVKILYGLVTPDSGSILLNNLVIKFKTPSEARANGIGMVFQHFSLFESLTILVTLIGFKKFFDKKTFLIKKIIGFLFILISIALMINLFL